MKIKMLSKIDVAELGEEKVMIDYDNEKYFVLKGIAYDIIDELVKHDFMEFDTLVQILESIYDVEDQVCREEVLQYMNQLEELGLVSLMKEG